MCVTPTGTFSQPSTSLCQNTTVRSDGEMVGHVDGLSPEAELVIPLLVVPVLPLVLVLVLPLALLVSFVVAVEL